MGPPASGCPTQVWKPFAHVHTPHRQYRLHNIHTLSHLLHIVQQTVPAPGAPEHNVHAERPNLRHACAIRRHTQRHKQGTAHDLQDKHTHDKGCGTTHPLPLEQQSASKYKLRTWQLMSSREIG